MFTGIRRLGQFIVPSVRSIWAGVLLVTAVALVSRFVHGLIPGPFLSKAVSEVLVAVLLGLLIRNTVGITPGSAAGINFSVNRVLRLGIILLGLRLSLQDVAATGLAALALVVVCIAITLLLAFGVGRLLRIPPRLVALIGIGTAICGNSAIIATAPVIESRDEEVSFAVATITLFGLLAVLIYPLVGQAAGLSDRAFGLWAGTAVNDTSQVLAAGAAFSSQALNIATVVKLTRNILMAPIIVLIGLVYQAANRNRCGEESRKAARFRWSALAPGFVIGFLLMSLVRTVGVAAGVLPLDLTDPGSLVGGAQLLNGMDEIARFAILMALSAVGLSTRLGSMRRIGLKPLLAGACVALALALTSLGLVLYSPLGM